MAVNDLPAHANDLDEILAEAFRLFSRGVADRRSAFRALTVATIGPDHTPHVRSMVLRRFDPQARRLILHSDRRAAKLADLAQSSRVAIHVYDARAALQIRLSATAQLHIGDDVATAAWNASAPFSRAIYAVVPAPGSEIAAPPPAPSDPEAGFDHFAVVELIFNSLEWLWLHHAGHRRARFTWDADGAVRATWLVP